MCQRAQLSPVCTTPGVLCAADWRARTSSHRRPTMIRRFSLPRLSRTDTTADLVDGLLATFTAVPADEDTGRDRSLEILVKNANPTDTLDDSHARRIWRDLRKRITGPFGRLAIEGPVRST